MHTFPSLFKHAVNVGLAIGLSVASFILFCVVAPVITCICTLIFCCKAGEMSGAVRTVTKRVPASNELQLHPMS